MPERTARRTYRYRGTDRDGGGRYGVRTDTLAGLAAQVEKWYQQGWRTLTVAAGDGPVPPAEGEELQVAGIGLASGRTQANLLVRGTLMGPWDEVALEALRGVLQPLGGSEWITGDRDICAAWITLWIR